MAVSLPEEKPVKKEGEVEEEEPINPYPETDRDGKPIALPNGKPNASPDGDQIQDPQKIKITTIPT